MNKEEAKKELDKIREYVNQRIDRQERNMDILESITEWRRSTIGALADVLEATARKIDRLLNETDK